MELVQPTFDPPSPYENLEYNLLKFQICKIGPPPLDFSGTLDIFPIPDIYHKDPLSQDFYTTIYYFTILYIYIYINIKFLYQIS